jgi:hypothetical protein
MFNKKPIAPIVLILLVLITITKNALAITPLSAKELASHCVVYPKAPDSLDGQFCVRYIQGFIDGAIATDAQVMLNIEAEILKDKETLTERALSTRGAGQSSQKRVEKYAEYCLGEEIELVEIANKVIEALIARGEIDSTILARRVVYGTLKKDYPCKTKTKNTK